MSSFNGGVGHRVQVATHEQVLAQRNQWSQLVDCMRFPTPFATWEWVDAWLEVFGSEVDPLILFVYKNDVLIGILPLGIRRKPATQRLLTGSTIEVLGSAHVGADHLDIIAAPSDVDDCARAIADWLDHAGLRWREWRCTLVTEDSALHKRSGGFGRSDRSRVRSSSKAPYISVSGTFEQYLQGLSSNERYKLRSRSRKLFARDDVEYCSFERESRKEALSRLFDLHERRAGEKAIVSSFSGAAINAFHNALLDRLSWDRVWLRGLKQGHEVFAMFYGFKIGGRVFYFQLGYDPARSDASPGLVLLTRTIQEAFESGSTEYNFLQGDESFKQTWTKQARDLFDCRYHPAGLLGNLSYRLDHTRDWLVGQLAAFRNRRANPEVAPVPPAP